MFTSLMQINNIVYSKGLLFLFIAIYKKRPRLRATPFMAGKSEERRWKRKEFNMFYVVNIKACHSYFSTVQSEFQTKYLSLLNAY